MNTTSIKETVNSVITTAPVGLVPTSYAPPFVVRPQPHANTAICRPNTTALISMNGRSVKTIQPFTEFQKTFGGML